MTIADTLYDAADDIRDYLKDDVQPYNYGELAAEITDIVARMDALREKIDALGSPVVRRHRQCHRQARVYQKKVAR